MGLFSKPKIPSYDIGAMNRLAQDTANRKRALVGGLKTNLAPVYDKFRTGREELSQRIPTETENLLTKFGTDIQGVNQGEQEARTQANIANRVQSFRNVPELQRAVRESLGGSGLLNSGAALSTLARPTLDAARGAADFEMQNEGERLRNEAARREGLATTGYNARSNAMATRLGLDEDTLQFLTDSGRGDLINEANSLLGVEGDLGSSLEQNEQLRQSQEIAKAQANAARRGSIISSLGQFGGAGLGFLAGGPMGAALGSQLGGAAAGFAGGQGGGNFDPTLLFALSQRQPNNRTAVVKSLGGRVNVGTGSY